MTHVSQNINDTLDCRARTYGNYEDHARITQNIKAAMADSRNWDDLSAHLKETLEMLAHKVGRILNGEQNYIDSVRDCVGYLKLSQIIMERTEGATDVSVSRTQLVGGEWCLV